MEHNMNKLREALNKGYKTYNFSFQNWIDKILERKRAQQTKPI